MASKSHGALSPAEAKARLLAAGEEASPGAWLRSQPGVGPASVLDIGLMFARRHGSRAQPSCGASDLVRFAMVAWPLIRAWRQRPLCSEDEPAAS